MQHMLAKLAVGIISLLPMTSVMAADVYTIDPAHTFVTWHISHFGYSTPSGKWAAEGTLVLDEKNPANSKVNVTIDTGKFITGIPKLDEHLSSAEFFDVVKFPKAIFVSDKVVVTGKNTAKVHGILTVHGVSKSVVLKVTLNKLAPNPISHKMTAGFSATTEINRTDFGINAYSPGLGDKVKINIDAEAYK